MFLRVRVWGGLAGLTVLAAGVLGYHPYAEDGGIYVAEIKGALDPRLYPAWGGFVAGHLGRWPGFVDGVSWVARETGWRLDSVMLGLHLLCLLGVLVGVWLLAGRCGWCEAGRWGAVGAVAVCGGMPVAGTSLMLIDPYATARSVALAFTVLGIAGVAMGRWWSIAALGGVMLVHPLMGGYGFGEAVVLRCLLSGRRLWRAWGVAGSVISALAIAGVLQAMAPVEAAEYARVAATRYYWFLGEWQWYEVVGVAAPLGILGWAGWRGRGVVRGLAWMGVVVGVIGLGVAGIFAREGMKAHAVARLQPLRCFLMVYLVMLMVLGAWVGESVLRVSWWRWFVAGAGLAGGMMMVQRETYPASGHLELPGARLQNRWEEAFVWVRDNAPREALFGLDADYVHRAGEDAQGFRAIGERSALPDYSKDGGQAAIRPELTEAWAVGQAAQAGLTEETDAERVRKLGPLSVTWVVMGREARTGFVCPYANELVMVCRLGR